MNAKVAMQRAIDISQFGLGKTKGNPIVGAVIFNETEIIAEGFHQSGPHAEVVAIENAKKAGANLSDASIAVTLEPCGHHGNTGPCTDAIIKSGIKEVFFAVKDPNEVAAGGAAQLINASVKVSGGLLEIEAAHVNRAWLATIAKKRPYFTWKIASTLDGKIAAADGSSKWITNSESRAYVQQLRAQSDAILVGTGTVIADNPNLIPEGFEAKPLRIAVGKREIPSTAKISDRRAHFYHHNSHDLFALITELNNRNIVNVLVEAGPTLGSAMVKAGLIDELALFTAPKILGAGANFVADLGITEINNAIELSLIDSKQFAGDSFNLYKFTDRNSNKEAN